MASEKVPLSIFLWLLLTAPFAIPRIIFSKDNRKRTWERAIGLAVGRHLLTGLAKTGSAFPLQSFFGYTTGNNYRAWAKKRSITPVSDDVSEGGYIHWIGEKSLGKVMLYFHGGGFSVPALDQTMDMLKAFQEDVEPSVGKVGIAILEYFLTPTYRFPIQLRQANAAMSFLFSHGVSPSNLVLAGDSSGGNQILQILSHEMHPIPSIPPPPKLSAPIRGGLLISPWVSFHDNWPSFKQNAERDVLPVPLYQLFCKEVEDSITPELADWVQPISAPPEWWTDVPKFMERMLVTKGECECIYDEITEMSKTLKPHVPDFKELTQANGVHEDFTWAFATSQGRKSPGYDELIHWLKATFA